MTGFFLTKQTCCPDNSRLHRQISAVKRFGATMTFLAKKTDDSAQNSSNSLNLNCKFTPHTRSALTNYSLRFAESQQRPQHENAQQKLCAFMRACVVAGCAGRIPRKRLYEVLSERVWAGASGPRFSRRCVDKWMGVFCELGVISTHDGDVLFTQWLPGWCPSQAELDSMHAYKRANTRARVARHRASHAQALRRFAPENVELSGVYEGVTHTMSLASPEGVGAASHGKAEQEYLSQHPDAPLNGFAHRSRQAPASDYDPDSPAESAVLDALALAPWPDEQGCQLASGPVALARATRCVGEGHVASVDAFDEELSGVEDRELAATLARVRRLAPASVKQTTVTASSQPPRPAPAPPRAEQPEPVVKPRRFRPYAVMATETLLSVMREQGAGNWGVNWSGCQRWALSEAVLLDAIDATKRLLARGSVTNTAALFNSVLRNKARKWMDL